MASDQLPRPSRSHTPLALAVVAALALLLAACGGGGSEKASGVASLSGNASTTTTPKSTSTDTRQAWLDVAACMRKQGIDFPDPTFDANGRPQFGQNGAGVPGGGGGGGAGGFRNPDPKTAAARKACSAEFAKVRGQFQAQSPAELAKRKKDILALAACMRDQGLDFPDPTFDANGRPQFGGSGSGAGGGLATLRNNPAFQKAFQTCQTKLGTTFGPGGRGGPGGGGGAPATTAGTTGNA